MEQYILAASLALQLIAAALAIALIGTTRALWAWMLIAGALVLMTGRRAITLAAVMSGRAHADLSAELVALVISIAMVAGMALIRPVFTRMRRLADELADREQNLRALIESAPDGIALVHGDRWRYVNPAFVRMLGAATVAELGAESLLDLIHPADRAAFAAPLEPDGADDHVGTTRELRFRTASGDYVPLELVYGPNVSHEGEPARLLQLRDLSERKQLEAQLLEASKMEAIGRLSGGIAHDFNNILTIVLTATALARERLAPNDPMHEELSAIDGAGERASKLTAQLLAYARTQPFSPSVFDLNVVVGEMSEMLRPLVGEDVRVEIATSSDPVPVRADRGQVEQVVMNLVVNARDAMPKGGVLRIETLQDPKALPDAGGAGVLLVRDDGVGMDARVKERIFEPFFTTKPVGQGTGLGLSSSFGIVARAGGRIQVDSAPGEGATFRVVLPRASTAELAPPPPPPSARVTTGSEHVLLVEDERELGRLAAGALRGRGYEVKLADGPEAALAWLASSARAPDLLLTDVVMPGLDGRELARRVRARHPDIPIVFMTGYGEHVLESADEIGPAPVLPKPFTPEALASAVRHALDAARARRTPERG